MTRRDIDHICSLITQAADGRKGEIEDNLWDVLGEIQDRLEFPLPPRSRSQKAISDAAEEFCDKVWYNRHRVLQERILNRLEPPCDPKVWKGALAAARRIEQTYRDETLLWDDFEWGMINGKLSALRWVMGDEWDMLDT